VSHSSTNRRRDGSLRLPGRRRSLHRLVDGRKTSHPSKPPFPPSPRRQHVEVPAVRVPRPLRAGARAQVARAPQPRGEAAGHQPLRSRLGAAHRPLEDRVAQAGPRPTRLRPGLRRRPAHRGKVAGQGAGVLDPFGAAPVGSQGAATRAPGPLQRPPGASVRNFPRDSPYRPPENPELRVDTVGSPEQAAEQIAQHLFANGLSRQR